MTVYKSSSKIADTGVHGINFGSQQIKQIFTAPRTNGITYIPQDIKFEIVDGTTPTLYAGSEVWVPYGRNAPEYSIGDSLNSGIITAISWDGSALFYKVRYDTDLNIDITDDPASADFVTSISPYHGFWWFSPDNVTSMNGKPAHFEVHGNLTVNNSIVSGFSAGSSLANSNYLISTFETPSSISSFDYIVDFKLNSLNASLLSSEQDFYGLADITVNSAGKIAIWISSNGTSYDVAENKQSSYVCSVGQEYRLRFWYTNDYGYRVDIIAIGKETSWSRAITIENKKAPFGGKKLIIGLDQSRPGSPLNGEVNMMYNRCIINNVRYGHPYYFNYNLTDNVVEMSNNGGVTWDNYGSLPIGVFTMAGTGATKKLKYVFNGFGYIGSTAYAVPGVKGLMADGLNEDGSYKSIEQTFDRFVMRTTAFDRTAFYGVVLDGEYTIHGDNYMEAAELPAAPDGYVFCYRKSDNTLWWTLNNNTWVQRHGLPIGFWTTSTGGISNFNPAKNFIKVYQYNSYEPNTVLCNISNGASSSVEFRKGVYYIRGQGAGGGGGRNGYFGNGQGGGSGAGFEGYIYVKRDLGAVSVSAGVGGTEAYDGNPGTDTVIGQLITLGGGKGGAGENKAHVANAGILTINSSDNWEILSYTVKSNGNQGLEARTSASFISGGNSVLTGDGGGPTSDSNHDASAPGAGGGGGWSFNISGGAGGAGECLIQYISYEPEGVTNLEYFKTPTLTGSITPVAEGNIVVTSSYNNTSSWNNLCNNSYIMRNTISTTSDKGYWQMNGSSTQWLNIHFPYTLLIKELTIASRPNDNYTGTVTAYTNANKTVNMGSVTTNAGATNFILTNIGIGDFVTDTIYLYITDMDEWYGLQNLQIRGYKVKKNT
jgi:hypothetical protein